MKRLIALFSSKPKDTGIVVRVHEGKVRAAAVAQYIGGQAQSLRRAYDEAAHWRSPDAAMYQAGAAASQAMSDLLLAAVSNDKQGFKEAFNAFINDAVDSGVVAV